MLLLLSVGPSPSLKKHNHARARIMFTAVQHLLSASSPASLCCCYASLLTLQAIRGGGDLSKARRSRSSGTTTGSSRVEQCLQALSARVPPSWSSSCHRDGAAAATASASAASCFPRALATMQELLRSHLGCNLPQDFAASSAFRAAHERKRYKSAQNDDGHDVPPSAPARRRTTTTRRTVALDPATALPVEAFLHVLGYLGFR